MMVQEDMVMLGLVVVGVVELEMVETAVDDYGYCHIYSRHFLVMRTDPEEAFHRGMCSNELIGLMDGELWGL